MKISAQLKVHLTKTWVQVGLFAIGLAVVRFLPFFLGKTVFFGDNYNLLAIGKIWSAFWLKQGVYPLWNPYLFSGLNWVGDISQSLLSVSTIPFVLLPPTLALNVTILAHFVFTFVGMYLLTRAIVKDHWWSVTAAGLWAVSSLWTGAANNLATLQSLSWFPWVLWAGLRLEWRVGAIVRLALVIAGFVTAGYPQHLLVTLPAAAGLSLAMHSRRQWLQLIAAWIMATVAALGLSAPLSLPFVAALLDSTRQIMSAEQAARGSFHPAELIKLALPMFFDAPRFGIRWGPNWNFFPTNMPYFSAFGLLLLLTASWRKLLRDRIAVLLLAAMLIGFLLSLGSYIPGYLQLLQAVPILAMIRYPSTWLFLPELFGLILLAHVGKSWRPPAWLNSKLTLLLLLATIAGVSLFFGWQYYAQELWLLANTIFKGKLAASAFHTWERDQLIGMLIGANIALNATLALAAWICWKRHKRLLVVVLLVLDGLLNSQSIMLFAPANVYQPPEHFAHLSIVQAVQDPSYRTLTRDGNYPYTDFGSYWEAIAVRPPFSDSFVDEAELQTAAHLQRLRDGIVFDWNIVASVPVVNGYTTLLPISYQNLWQHTTETRVNLVDYIDTNNPLLAEWAVKYYIVDTWFVISEEEQAYLDTLPLVLEDQTWQVYELPALSRFRFEDTQPATISAFQETPNRISLTVDNSANYGWLLVADRYESGWRARVNGQDVRVENSNGMRRIPIAAGLNQIEMWYSPKLFWLGLWVSAITAVVIGAVMVFDGRLRRQTRLNPKQPKISRHR